MQSASAVLAVQIIDSRRSRGPARSGTGPATPITGERKRIVVSHMTEPSLRVRNHSVRARDLGTVKERVCSIVRVRAGRTRSHHGERNEPAEDQDDQGSRTVFADDDYDAHLADDPA